MQFDETLNGGARAAAMPRIERLDSPAAVLSPSTSFVRHGHEGLEEWKLGRADSFQPPRLSRAKTMTKASVAGRQSQHRPKLLRHQSSIHKQDEDLPGNFYYLRPGEEAQQAFENGTDAQMPFASADSQAKIPVAELLSAEDANDVRSWHSAADQGADEQRDGQSPQDSSDEEVDSFCSRSRADGATDEWALGLSTQEKSLIARYKTLERLMKKKKMLG